MTKKITMTAETEMKTQQRLRAVDVPPNLPRLAALFAALMLAVSPTSASAQLSDERVSLPDGPGSIGGVGENVDVNANMGSASFRVPFRVPRGATEPLTPSLALSYASGRGMGNVGIGWELASPSIERTTDRGLPTYTTSDRFAADGGSELVYVGDIGGSRVYRARYESGFVRYRWFGAGSGAAGYWTAEYPDGRIGYYGASEDGTFVPTSRVQADSGETFRYHLVEVVDTSGRRIVQRFTKSNGWVLLDEVQYAFGGLETPRFSVRFVYEDRPDVLSNATPGYEIRLTQRLSEVRVLSEAATIRRYELNYEMGASSGGMSRLQNVAEFGRDGTQLPIAQSFTYSRTLGGACEVGCEQPFMVDMGSIGVTLATGRAQLIDINGDSLPDVVSSSEGGQHTFFVSELSEEGRASFSAGGVPSEATAGGSSLILGDNGVQLFDVNGDGFMDVVNQRSGDVLCNDGTGDWSGSGCTMNPTALPNLDDDADADVNPEGMRFFDYDNDKLIDLLVTGSDASAQVFRNTGTDYVAVTIDAIGSTFDAATNLELADMNGDGLLDPTRIVGSGAGSIVSYRINTGFGTWLPFEDVALDDLPSGLADSAELQDINGDGLDDVVVVAGTNIRYWLNRNGNSFDPAATLGSGDVDGEIPETTASETVLFADMNGNGTDDIVWVNGSGSVRFLELFPVRPNLLSRIENGIGFVRVVEYGTSIAQRARDIGTANEWQAPLPHSMNVVTATDTWTTLTGDDDGSGVHARREFVYHSGYYDGTEKDFRGYELVERRMVSDMAMDGQEPGLEVLEFDVGREDTYRNGLLVVQSNFGGTDGTDPINQTRTVYEDCPVAETEDAVIPVRFICDVESLVTSQEGRPMAEWRTVRTEREYDGYGNLIEQRDHGVIGLGDPDSLSACGACTAPDGLRSGACGPQCLGDEQISSTTFIAPGVSTDGAWMLRLPVRQTTREAAGGISTEVVSYYDGPDFVGLDEGEATRGLLTREMQRVSGSEMIPVARTAYDELGSVVAILDPNGSPDDATEHRRDYEYDERGLRATRMTIRAGEYDLVQDISYESSFLQVSEATSQRVVQGGTELTPRNASSFRYDEYGRITSIIRPGDSESMPTESFEYELADPVTRVVARARRTPGGPMDVETIYCRDGLDRLVQTRARVGDGQYEVDGFTVYNSSGSPVRAYLAFSDTTADCDMAPPADVPFAETRYDSQGRPTARTVPDSAIYGSASNTLTTYGPLTSALADENDTDADSEFAGTITTSETDGLGRIITIDRILSDSETATYRVYYDELGRVARVDDPMGNSRTQEFDLADRATQVVDPNSGRTAFEYDAAGNIVRQTDARGQVRVSAYDALNRLSMRWDDADMSGTLELLQYDIDEECADCRNTAGRLVGQTYPLPTTDEPGRDLNGYDPRGRRVLLRRTLEGTTFDTSYVFDGSGALTSATYPDGQVLEYGYDEASRPTSIAGVIESASYNERGRLAEVVHSNGVTGTYEYDALVRAAGISFTGADGVFFDIDVERDRYGNVTSITDGVDAANHPSHAATYSYDSWYRVTSAQVGDETLEATYDLLDNLTSRSSSLGAASPAHVGDYAYAGAGPNSATQVGGTAYGYDEAGNVSSRGDLQLVWDHLGRLIQATPEGEQTSEFAYAPSGERVFKAEHGGATYYAAPDFVVRDGISSLYPRLDSMRVARLRRDIAADVLPDQNGDESITIADAWLGRDGAQLRGRLLRSAARRLLHEASDPQAHLHANLQGSVIASTDSAGSLIAERAFYPYGLERGATGYVDEYAFTGKERDETTGLYAFRARYLDPMAGRWTAVDPLFGVLDGSNVVRLGESTAGYAYVANNPINAVDPTGLAGKLLRKVARTLARRAARRTARAAARGARTVGKGAFYGAVLATPLFVFVPKTKAAILPHRTRGKGGGRSVLGSSTRLTDRSNAARATANEVGARKSAAEQRLARLEDGASLESPLGAEITAARAEVDALRAEFDPLDRAAARAERDSEFATNRIAILAFAEFAALVGGIVGGVGGAILAEDDGEDGGGGGGGASGLFGGG